MESKIFEPMSCHLYWLAREAYFRCLETEKRKAEKIKQARAELEDCKKRMQDRDPEIQEGCMKNARLNLIKCKAMIQPDAVTTVILSVTTLEGFINELTDYSRWNNPAWEKWGAILYEAEQSNISTKCKYLLAAYVIGKPFNPGAPPFQDFDLLIKLRNKLVHPKSLVDDKVVEKVLKQIMGGAAFNSKYRPDSSLGYNDICSLTVAEWACNTASKMIQAMLDKLPAGGTKEAFKMMLFCKQPDEQNCFQPV